MHWAIGKTILNRRIDAGLTQEQFAACRFLFDEYLTIWNRYRFIITR